DLADIAGMQPAVAQDFPRPRLVVPKTHGHAGRANQNLAGPAVGGDGSIGQSNGVLGEHPAAPAFMRLGDGDFTASTPGAASFSRAVRVSKNDAFATPRTEQRGADTSAANLCPVETRQIRV